MGTMMLQVMCMMGASTDFLCRRACREVIPKVVTDLPGVGTAIATSDTPQVVASEAATGSSELAGIV